MEAIIKSMKDITMPCLPTALTNIQTTAIHFKWAKEILDFVTNHYRSKIQATKDEIHAIKDDYPLNEHLTSQFLAKTEISRIYKTTKEDNISFQEICQEFIPESYNIPTIWEFTNLPPPKAGQTNIKDFMQDIAARPCTLQDPCLMENPTGSSPIKPSLIPQTSITGHCQTPGLGDQPPPASTDTITVEDSPLEAPMEIDTIINVISPEASSPDSISLLNPQYDPLPQRSNRNRSRLTTATVSRTLFQTGTGSTCTQSVFQYRDIRENTISSTNIHDNPIPSTSYTPIITHTSPEETNRKDDNKDQSVDLFPSFSSPNHSGISSKMDYNSSNLSLLEFDSSPDHLEFLEYTINSESSQDFTTQSSDFDSTPVSVSDLIDEIREIEPPVSPLSRQQLAPTLISDLPGTICWISPAQDQTIPQVKDHNTTNITGTRTTPTTSTTNTESFSPLNRMDPSTLGTSDCSWNTDSLEHTNQLPTYTDQRRAPELWTLPESPACTYVIGDSNVKRAAPHSTGDIQFFSYSKATIQEISKLFKRTIQKRPHVRKILLNLGCFNKAQVNHITTVALRSLLEATKKLFPQARILFPQLTVHGELTPAEAKNTRNFNNTLLRFFMDTNRLLLIPPLPTTEFSISPRDHTGHLWSQSTSKAIYSLWLKHLEDSQQTP